jgi:hypothetical protein
MNTAINIPSLHSADGGTLARAQSHEVPRAGLFPFPSRTSQRAPCSVRLVRDARSFSGLGLRRSVGANRAICMRDGRRRLTVCSAAAYLSLHFGEAAQEFRAHHANRNEAGLVLRIPTRQAGAGHPLLPVSRSPVSLKVDHFAHVDGSICFLSRTGKHARRSFHGIGKTFHDSAG